MGRMACNPLILLTVVTICLLWTVSAKDCSVVKSDNVTSWKDNLIFADNDNYTATAVCRCSEGIPKWTVLQNGIKVTIENTVEYCINGSQEFSVQEAKLLDGYNVYAKLNNYRVTESLTLLCRNSDFNYAPGITVVLLNSSKAVDNCTVNNTVITSTQVITSCTTDYISTTTINSLLPSITSTVYYQSTTTVITTATTLPCQDAAFEEVKNERDNFKSATVVVGVGLGLAALLLVFTTLVLCIINKRRHPDIPEGDNTEQKI